MHRVIKMAGGDISDKLAQRLVIELEIDNDAMNDFKICINELSLKPINCHPAIFELIRNVQSEQQCENEIKRKES